MKKFLTIAFMALLLAVPMAKAAPFITTVYTTSDMAFEMQCVYDQGDGSYIISIQKIHEMYAIDAYGVITLGGIDVNFVDYDGYGNDLSTTVWDYSVETELSMSAYGDQIKEIRFEGGYNVPADFARYDQMLSFTNPTALEKVFIGKYVQVIDEDAFAYNFNLETIEFEDRTESLNIEKGAFCGAWDKVNATYVSMLKELTLPDKINKIGEAAFIGHPNLEELTIPASLNTLGSGAFSYCGIRNLTVEDPLYLSPTGAIFKDNPIEHVTIYGHPTDMGGGVTYYATGVPGELLRGVLSEFDVKFLPEDGKYSLMVFGSGALAESGVYRIDMPQEMVYSAEYPDFGMYVGNEAFMSTSNLTSLDLSMATANKTMILDDAFLNSSIETLPLANTVMVIGENAFSGSMLSGALNLPQMHDPVADVDMPLILGDYAFANTLRLSEVNIGGQVNGNSDDNYLGNGVFEHSRVKKVTLPESLEVIDKYALAYTGIESITLGSKVKTLGEGAFAGCELLKSADLSAATDLVILPEYAFAWDRNLTDLKLPADMLKWDNYALENIGVKTLNVDVEYLGNYVFEFCENLEKVIFSNPTMTTVKEGTMFNLPKLKEVDFGEYVTTLEANAIYNCDAFDSLVITPNMKSIGQYPISYSSGSLKQIMFKATDFDPLSSASDAPFYGYMVESLYVDPSVKNVPEYTFAGMMVLNNVEITDEQVFHENAFLYAEIGNLIWHYPTRSTNPFAKCSFIHKLSFTDVKEIPDLFFAGVGISDINLDGVEVIGRKAFSGCGLDNGIENNYTLTIPASVKEIKDEAFYDAGAITLVFEKGESLAIGSKAFVRSYNHYDVIRTNYPKDNIPVAASDAFEAVGNCEVVFAGDCDAVADYQVADGWKEIKTLKWDGVSTYSYKFELVGAEFPISDYDLINNCLSINGEYASNTFIGCDNKAKIAFDPYAWVCSNKVFDHWEDLTTDQTEYNIELTSDTVIRIYITETAGDLEVMLSDASLADVFKIWVAPSSDPENEEELSGSIIRVNDCWEGNKDVRLEMLDPDHYDFEGWFDETDALYSYDLKLYALFSAGKLTAKVKPREFSVSVSQAPYCYSDKCVNRTDDLIFNGASVGKYGSGAMMSYNTEASVEFVGTSTATERYILVQWNDYLDTKVSEDNPYVFNVTSDIILYPEIKSADQYAVNVLSSEDAIGSVALLPIGDAEVLPAGSGLYWEKSQVEISATPKDSHFHFVGWSDDNTDNPRTVTVLGNVDYTAVFSRDSLDISVSVSGVDPSLVTLSGSGRYGWGNDVTLTFALTDDVHYEFTNWSYGSITSTATDLVISNVQADIDVVLTVTPKSYTISATADPSEGGSITGIGSYEYKSVATLKAEPAAGWKFTEWADDPAAEAERKVEVLSDASFTAKFEHITHEITVTSVDDKMGAVTGGGTYNEGATATVEATAKEGYKFTEWSNGEKANPYSFTVTKDENLIAGFEIIMIEVTAKSADDAQGSVTGGGSYAYGSEVTVEATPAEGYKFKQWKEDGITDAKRTFTATADVTLTAEFEIVKVTLTVKSEDDAKGTVTGGGTVDYGTTLKIEAKPAEHYDFAKWDDENTDNPRDVVVKADQTITALFVKTQHTITVKANNDEWGTVTGGGTFDEGSKVTIEATPAEHYQFVQWNDGDKNAKREITVDADATYTAEFEIVKVTLTVKSEDDAKGTVTGGGTVDYGTTVKIEAKPATHYEFAKWDDENTDNPRDVVVTADLTITALFAMIQHTITVKANNDAYGTVTGGGTFDEGSKVTIEAKPAEHYQFVQWNDGDKNAKREITVDADATYTAEFAIITRVITVKSADETKGTVTGSGTYNDGETIKIAAIAAEGFKFEKWDDGNTDNPREIVVSEDKTFIATFVTKEVVIVKYTITVESADETMGTVSGSGEYVENSKIEIKAIPAAGHKFVQWSDGNTDNPREITVTEDKTFTAEFAVKQFTITTAVNNAEWGTVTGGGTYDYAKKITLTATANEGYEFVEWKEDGDKNNPRHLTVSEDATFTAVFQKKIVKFTITALSSDDKLGSVTGSGEYEEGATVTLTAVPAEGCEFVQWNNGSKENPLVFTASENKTFVANFQKKAEPKEYTITVKSNNDDWGTVKGGGTAKEGEKLTIEATAKEGYKFLQWNDGDKTNPREITVTKDETYTAQFAKEDAKTYVIEAAANNAEWGSVKGGGEYAEGAEVVLFAVAAEGYQFVEWSTGSKDNPLVFNATENASITAVFEAKPEEKKFTITAAAADDKTGSVTGGGEYAEGATATLTAIPATGYEFVQWNDGDKSNPRSITVTENKTFIATFKKIEDTPVMVTVTVQSADENMGMAYGTKTVEQGTPVSIAAVAKSGYKFLQWSDGDTENPRVVIAEKDILIIAQFAKEDAKTFKVSAVSANDEQGQVLGSGEYAENATATLIAVAKDGFKFVQWNDGNTDNPRQVVVTEDKNFVALFDKASSEQQKYTITVGVNDEQMGIATGSGEYAEGQVATLAALPNNGYRFVQWNDGVKDNPRYVTVTANTAFTATFEKIPEVEKTYTLTVISNDIKMGNVIGSGTYKENETVTIGALANSGYKFVRWNDGSTENPRVITVTEDKTFIAIFEKDGSEKQQYTITISSSDESMGTVQGAGEFTLDEGTVLVIVAQAKPDHHFVNWENGSTDVKRIITVTEDHAYIAFFEKNKPVVPTYIVTVLSADETMGTVSGTGAYAEGTVITIRAIANDGYEFDHWSDGSVEAVREISVTANAKFVATFRAKKNYFALNALSSNNSEGTVTGAGIYEEGSVVTIEAVPAEGYHFVQWSDGNTDNPRQVTVNDNITLIAIFASGSAVETLDAVRDQVRKVMIDGHVYMILPDGRTYDANGRQVK